MDVEAAAASAAEEEGGNTLSRPSEEAGEGDGDYTMGREWAEMEAEREGEGESILSIQPEVEAGGEGESICSKQAGTVAVDDENDELYEDASETDTDVSDDGGAEALTRGHMADIGARRRKQGRTVAGVLMLQFQARAELAQGAPCEGDPPEPPFEVISSKPAALHSQSKPMNTAEF